MTADAASDSCGADGALAVPKGPLRRHPDNPRYFSDSTTGKPVYLTGSHNWSNVQEIFSSDPSKEFDYAAYLSWLESFGIPEGRRPWPARFSGRPSHHADAWLR